MAEPCPSGKEWLEPAPGAAGRAPAANALHDRAAGGFWVPAVSPVGAESLC